KSDHERTPALPSHLPLVSIDEDARDKLRAVFAETAPPTEAVIPAPEPSSDERAVAAPTQQSALTLTTLPIGEAWRFPSSAQIVLARFEGEGVPGPDSVPLSPTEGQSFAAEAAGKAALKQREWLAARAAAKTAMGALMQTDPQTTETVKFVDGHTEGQCGERSCALSLAHKGGIAVAAAAAQSPVGIDIELIARLRDGHGMEQRVLTDTERTYLSRCSDRLASFFMLWTMKEATAKAFGVGFVGQEAAFEVEAINDLGQEGIVAFQGRRATAYARRRGDYWVTLAMEGVAQ
ncbi:MAG: 4'-phosphopantetheinyl transferase superfamily protein, partial [Pseudomonadota bacterium]